jgi:hypothetical protein
MKTELFVKNKLFVSVITVLLLVGCSGGSDSSDQNSDLSSQNEAPLSPFEKFQNAKIDLLNGLSSGYLIYLGDDSISDMRSVTLDTDPEYKRISVTYDLAIDRGLFDDIYGANSSVNAPELNCKGLRDETMSKIFSVLKQNEDLIDGPSEGYEISLFWNVYDTFEDSFGGSEYKQVRKYGIDKVGISVSNWNKIKYDEYFETTAKFPDLSDLFKPTKNSYPRGRCNFEP